MLVSGGELCDDLVRQAKKQHGQHNQAPDSMVEIATTRVKDVAGPETGCEFGPAQPTGTGEENRLADRNAISCRVCPVKARSAKISPITGANL
jgi:hypothetical protein